MCAPCHATMLKKDPTDNTHGLVNAEARRQDELREAGLLMQNALRESDTRANTAANAHQKEINDLRAMHAIADAEKEARRIDAILAADTVARNTAADRAADAINALAVTTASNAENLRTALSNNQAATAKQTAEQQAANAKLLADTVSEITGRLGKLEQTISEGKGKQAYADPVMLAMAAKLESIGTSQSNMTGKSQGISAAVAGVIGVGSFALAIMGSTLFAGGGKGDGSNSVSTPQIIYVPAPQTGPTPIAK